MIRLAVLADPHLHDVRFGGEPDGQPLVRTLADSLHSTRVFNESEAALRLTLRQIAAEDIGLVVIPGDLTDDGQPANWAAARAMLDEHSQRHGTRFFFVPGNHDLWALDGKPLAKSRAEADGSVTLLAGRGAEQDGAVPCEGMRMVSAAEALAWSGSLGQARAPGDLLWETPFGSSDRPEDRTAPMTSEAGTARVPDASCLVEPVPELWLLLLDANVYLPNGTGGFSDRSHEGWSAALCHKPWLLGWITEVVRRATRGGKTLLAFSHYPMTDIFGGTLPQIDQLGAARAGRRRMPTPEESLRLSATGLRLHFSGHWHVDATATDPSGRLRNVAVPSTVGFPAGYKVLEVNRDRITVLDRTVDTAPGFDHWVPFQEAELRRTGGEQPAVLDAQDYKAFLDAHFRGLVLHRRLSEDWPSRLSNLMERTIGEVLGPVAGSDPAAQALTALPLREVLLDWYRLREAGGGPRAAVDPDRQAAYAALARSLRSTTGSAAGDRALVAVLLGTLVRLMEGPDRAQLSPPGVAAC